MRKLVFLLFLGLANLIYGQNARTDSLERELVSTPEGNDRIDLLIRLASEYRRTKVPTAFTYLKEAEQLLKQYPDPEAYAMLLHRKGSIYYNLEKFDTVFAIAEVGLAYAQSHKLVVQEGLFYSLFANTYGRTGKSTIAIQYNLKARTCFEKAGHLDYFAGTNTNIALYYEGRGKYDSAMVYLFESLKYKSDSGKVKLAVVELGNIGQLYHKLESYDLALQYNGKALAHLDTLKDFHLQSWLYANRGQVYIDIGLVDSALYYGKAAYQIDKSRNHAFNLITSSQFLGEVYEKNGQLELASYIYNEGLEAATSIGNPTHQATMASSLGSVFLKMGDVARAITMLEWAHQLSEQQGSMPNLAWSARLLSEAYEASNQYNLAFHFYKEHIAFRDSIQNAEKSKHLLTLERQFRSEQQAKQLAQQELQLVRQQGWMRNLLIGGLTLFLILLGLFQYLRYRQRLRRQETESALQLEKARARQLEVLDQIKGNFFANISHEFRTPLTLILGPIQQVLESDPGPNPSIRRQYLEVVQRNTLRLQELVDQLLDLSKIDSGRVQLQLQSGDLIRFIRAIVFSFESLAERQHIEYLTAFPDKIGETWYDADKWEKILINLLSNAFKFTPKGGRIEVISTVVEQGLRFKIKDSGRGMSAAAIEKVFDRFYQVEGTEEKGTGIGLALVRELVKIYQGTIEVDSEIGKGTSFTLTLPYKKEVFNISDLQPVSASNAPRLPVEPVSESSAETDLALPKLKTANLPRLLIVEDHPDLRHYIAEGFNDNYQVLLAAHGREGLQMAIEETPDLIISDVMMPEMDGFELCETLKKEERTSHIPVILLTAKAGQEHKLAGLETGADDYLTKPFDKKELQIRVQNLIVQRQQLREKFGGSLVLNPGEVAITSADEQFLQKVRAAIEENLSNELFSVEDLASAVAFSRSQLHRKLKALTGKSPIVLIRNFRLTRGKALLEGKAGTISEVAMEVGFSSPSYFTQCFKQAFGALPSDLS